MMLRAAAVGVLLAVIPLTVLLYHERQSVAQTKKELDAYKEQADAYQASYLYVLKRDAVAGEELTEGMLVKKELQSMEEMPSALVGAAEELIGKRLKVSLQKGAALYADLVYEGEQVAQDERSVELQQLYLPQTLQEDEFVDIRITFPNGEDYLVVGHKRVYQILRDEQEELQAIKLRLLEEELLRYQAARVDTTVYEDTVLYAVPYVGEYQQAGEVYYPVNPQVLRLLQWDPNITELFLVPQEQDRRSTLESHLKPYMMEEPEESEDAADDSAEASETTEAQTEDPLTLYTELPEEA